MKLIIVLFSITFSIATSLTVAFAQEHSFIGIYADSSRMRWSTCPFEGDLARVTMWIWCRPSPDGQHGLAMRIGYPDNIIQEEAIANDIVLFSIGDLDNGVDLVYNQCQMEWNWPYHQSLWVTSHEATIITIEPHSDLGYEECTFFTCEAFYPSEVSLIVSLLRINQLDVADHCMPPIEVVSVNQASWGAIKSLYRR